MKAHKLSRLSVEEYVQHEIETGLKHEYHDGKIYALAGGSINHGLLCGNIYTELRTGLKSKKSNCKPLTSEIKLFIKTKNIYVYPDTMVICGEMETAKTNKNAVTNPILVIEVLSKSTEAYDRGDKFYLYRQIPSLQEYVLIDQKKQLVEVYYKKAKNDLWRITRYEGIDELIKFQSLNLKISMKELYFDVNIDAGDS